MQFGGTYDKGSEAKEFTKIEQGTYCATIDNVTIEETAKGTDYLQFVVTIEGGDFHARKLWHKMWFTENAYNWTARQLDDLLVFENLSIAKNLKAFMNSAANACFKLVNKKIEIKVTGHEEYTDKKGQTKLSTKTDITGFLDIPNAAFQTGEPKKMNPENFDKSEELPF